VEPAVVRRGLATATLLAVLALALAPPVFDTGADRIDAMFGRALATFAVARGLNGVISVIQGTELALQPAGVGVTLTVGEVLDPLNDLVERFGWVMLAATAALGAQSVLLEAAADGVLAVALLVLGGLVIARQWWRPLAETDRGGLLPRLLLLLLFVRLAIPLSALAAHAFGERWLEPRRAAAVATLQATRERLDEVEAAAPAAVAPEDASIFEDLRRYLDVQRQRLDLDARLAALSDAADSAAERVVDLVVVFVLQTVAIPLGVLWLLWRATRALLPTWGGPAPREPPP
jgi:hypothetical protein